MSHTRPHPLIRTRWAAIGAAVAITLGAGGIGLVSATSPSDASAYIPIEPCRVADTRPAFNVGDKDTPIGAEATHTITAHGDNGQCTGIPTTATGLQLNVTALNATAGTFLAVWGSGDRPNASSLNPQPGQPPIPNAVTTGLTGTGQFNIFNRAGSVDVFVDIVGYYADHHHDDRYYTETEIDAELGAKADSADVYTKLEVDAAVSDAVTASLTEIPSGVTVTGNFSPTVHASVIDFLGFNLALPAHAPSPPEFGWGTDSYVETPMDPTCTGTVEAPTAPPGKICLYAYALRNVEAVVLGPLRHVPTAGIYVDIDPVAVDLRTNLWTTWAYTAP